ncbi:MAG: hypothetical protein NC299_14760 [Lachnospiraceae bacterium]|nr:hypothetical protein [Ruminococcus sp.]MCM1276598.1 hypothetical protein [Lachnospiraceae bacterium]
MANQIIRDELRGQKVFQWELAKALGISEATMLCKMQTKLSNEERLEKKIEGTHTRCGFEKMKIRIPIIL